VSTSAPKLRKAIKGKAPGLKVEQSLWAGGHDVVVGMDEVGKGAWAGPLTLGALVVPKDRRLYKVRDSKMLTEAEREAMFGRVTDWAVAWSVGHASPAECDALGMSDAQRLAANRALRRLAVTPNHALIDGHWDFVEGLVPGDATKVVKGDAKCLSIAAASIVAKVSRDRIMRKMALDYPEFAFQDNKGYPCPRHKQALRTYGVSAIHRTSWAFMDNLAAGA